MLRCFPNWAVGRWFRSSCCCCCGINNASTNNRDQKECRDDDGDDAVSQTETPPNDINVPDPLSAEPLLREYTSPPYKQESIQQEEPPLEEIHRSNDHDTIKDVDINFDTIVSERNHVAEPEPHVPIQNTDNKERADHIPYYGRSVKDTLAIMEQNDTVSKVSGVEKTKSASSSDIGTCPQPLARNLNPHVDSQPAPKQSVTSKVDGDDIMGFGKHCNCSYYEVASHHSDYVSWALRQPNPSPKLARFCQWLQAQGSSACVNTDQPCVRIEPRHIGNALCDDGGNERLNFGKHLHCTYRHVVENHSDYVAWAIKQKNQSPKLAKFCRWYHTQYSTTARVDSSFGTPAKYDNLSGNNNLNGNNILGFGKHGHRTYQEVATNHADYVSWALQQEYPSPKLARFCHWYRTFGTDINVHRDSQTPESDQVGFHPTRFFGVAARSTSETITSTDLVTLNGRIDVPSCVTSAVAQASNANELPVPETDEVVLTTPSGRSHELLGEDLRLTMTANTIESSNVPVQDFFCLPNEFSHFSLGVVGNQTKRLNAVKTGKTSVLSSMSSGTKASGQKPFNYTTVFGSASFGGSTIIQGSKCAGFVSHPSIDNASLEKSGCTAAESSVGSSFGSSMTNDVNAERPQNLIATGLRSQAHAGGTPKTPNRLTKTGFGSSSLGTPSPAFGAGYGSLGEAHMLSTSFEDLGVKLSAQHSSFVLPTNSAFPSTTAVPPAEVSSFSAQSWTPLVPAEASSFSAQIAAPSSPALQLQNSASVLATDQQNFGIVGHPSEFFEALRAPLFFAPVGLTNPSSPDKNIPTDTAVDLAEDGQVKTSDNSAKDNDDDDDGDDEDDDGEFDCDDSLSDASEHAWDSDTLAAVAKTTHHQMIKRQPILIGCNRDGSINVQLPNGNIIVAERSAVPKFDKTGPQEKRRQAQRIKKDQFGHGQANQSFESMNRTSMFGAGQEQVFAMGQSTPVPGQKYATRKRPIKR